MRLWIMIIATFFAVSGLYARQEPASRPGIIDVTDTEALERAMNQDATVLGVVERAQWSHTGKVMNIEFKGAENGFLAVVFERQRERLDGAFAGDLAKSLTGATVRLRGKIAPYGGHVEEMKGRPQMIIEYGNQITILEMAPTTQP